MQLKMKNSTWAKTLLVTHAAEFFAKKLKLPQSKRVIVDVEFVQGLRKREHCRGLARQLTAQKYLIQLERSLKPIAMIRCLAHEMIHVNQWMTGKMEDINHRQKVRWGSKVYASGLAYSKHPWEIEAYRWDKVLFRSLVLATRGKRGN